MTLSTPSRSLPPPAPPKVAAQTRIKALTAELVVVSDASARAALQYEIAALHESQLGDRARAFALYQEAALTQPGFRPPLFALARLLREEGDPKKLEQVLRALVPASRTDADVAAMLAELGILLDDSLRDPAGAEQRYTEALARDPACRTAGLMLERMYRLEGRTEHVYPALRARVATEEDPELASTLAWEVAEHDVAAGHIDDAIAVLLDAARHPARRYATLQRVAMLARTHARHAAAEHAYDGQSELLERHLAGDDFEGRDEVQAHFSDPDACRKTLAWQQREVGRLRITLGEDSLGTQAYARAHQHAPQDVSITLEYLLACRLSGDAARSRELGMSLRTIADPLRAAVLDFELAELAQAQGDRVEARARLHAALQADPDSPAAIAVLEDALTDDGAFDELLAHLSARAERSHGEERAALLQRAAAVASGPGADRAHAQRLYEHLVAATPDDRVSAREWLGAAVLASDHAAVATAAERLLALGVDDDEASALLRQRYQALLDTGDSAGAHALLVQLLGDPRTESWVPHVAAVVAALQRDYDLLQRAHARLAALTSDSAQAAAHLCAQGRALVRQGRTAQAIDALQRALQHEPGHAYAVALLEELLHAQGDDANAVQLLRTAAAAAGDARRGELALLHAGAIAEAAGDAQLAVRSYQEASERDPDALSPLWSLRRLSERTGDLRLELAALERLCVRQHALGPADVEHLELAALHDLLDEPGPAAVQLRAALSGSAAIDSAIDAVLLPVVDADPELRTDAFNLLERSVDDVARARLARERAAAAAVSGDREAQAALQTLVQSRSATASEYLAVFLACSDGAERADALRGLASTLEDPDARADLMLHAQRVRAQLSSGTDADALVDALATYEDAPAVLASAVALGESLSPSDDADLRVRALEARLQHTLPEASGNLSLALARALLDAGRASDAAAMLTQLVHQDPEDLCAWESLHGAAREIGDFETVVLACDTLAAHCEGELRCLLLEEAAAVLEEQLRRPDDAEGHLLEALRADDARVSVFERLHDLVLERGDFEGLSDLVTSRLRVTTTPEERSDLLYEHARLLRGLGHRDAALACIDELLALSPAHAGALGLAVEIHSAQRNWASAVEALRALGHADAPGAQRKLARKGAADFLERHLHDVQAAYAELEVLGRDGLADLSIWKRMADLAQRAGLWAQAVDALGQAARLSSGQARAALERRAGDILARDPERMAAACDAWRRALAAWPSDIEACEALCAALQADAKVPLLANFTTHLLAMLRKDPDNAPELRALRRAAQLAADRTLEHVSLCALAALGLASSDELAARDALEATVPAAPDDAWTEDQLQALLDAPVPELAWRFARIACKAWLDMNDDEPARYGVTRRDRLGKNDESPHKQALGAWASSFGLQVPELYVGGARPRDALMVMRPGHAQAWVIGSEVHAPFDKLTRFSVAQQCAAMHVGVLPLQREGKARARDILLATWFTAVPSSTPDGERLGALSQQVARKLSRAQRKELDECIAALPDPHAAIDAVIEAANTMCWRAGLVAACDPATAIGSALGTRVDGTSLSSSPKAVALLGFWTSNTLLSLRRELGLRA